MRIRSWKPESKNSPIVGGFFKTAAIANYSAANSLTLVVERS
jgi:hypothetical protein